MKTPPQLLRPLVEGEEILPSDLIADPVDSRRLCPTGRICHGLLWDHAFSPHFRPVAPAPTGIEAEVCADIQRRQQLGLQKYGVSVADNPLNLAAWLTEAYQECLDQAIYLKRAIRELPPLPKNCQKCGGDGLEEIQSGPYFRKCPACLGAGKEKAPPAKEAADSTP